MIRAGGGRSRRRAVTNEGRDLQELEEYGDEAYFDRRREGPRVFDSALLREPSSVLRAASRSCSRATTA